MILRKIKTRNWPLARDNQVASRQAKRHQNKLHYEKTCYGLNRIYFIQKKKPEKKIIYIIYLILSDFNFS